MPKRNPNNRLDIWEISLVKAMIAQNKLNDQDILAWFTRPTRSINHARIKEIRDGIKHQSVAPACEAELQRYLAAWPYIDPATGLQLIDDELLVKSREAMLHAVQGYNNPRTFFKSEVFIVIAIIAWTYLLHWHYRTKRIDFRYRRDGKVLTTKYGAERHWELEMCLACSQCPLDEPTKENLRFLIAIRHEIEHQMTRRIDDTISAKLQACCLNFSRAVQELAGLRYGLGSELSFALQFVSIGRDQRDTLLEDMGLPANIVAMQMAFEDGLSEEMIRDPQYSYRVALVEVAVNSRGKADRVIEYVRPEAEQKEEIERVLFKFAEKPKYKPGQIIERMRLSGFKRFNTHHHTELWKSMDAKNPRKGFGVYLKPGDWWWYESWLERVRAHCEGNGSAYK
jgi:hypothetical protein